MPRYAGETPRRSIFERPRLAVPSASSGAHRVCRRESAASCETHKTAFGQFRPFGTTQISTLDRPLCTD